MPHRSRSTRRRTPRPFPLVALLVLLALLGAACGSGSDEASETTESSVDVGDSTTSSAVDDGSTTTTEDTADDASTTTTEAVGDEALLSDLEWTVVAVTWDDVLNVRADPDPGADLVGSLEPWSQAFVGHAETETVDGALWRRVTLDDGSEGWVNARYIAAQPETLSAYEETALVEATTNLVYWALQTEPGHDGAPLLAERALWVGGIGVYADLPQWNWIPASEADSIEDWSTVRTFELDPAAGDVDCGSFCDQTITEFVGFETLGDEWTVTLESEVDTDRNGFTDGEFYEAPAGFHRTVIDKPASEGTDAEGNPMIELDWQRIHVVHDWSADPSGEPGLLLIHTWGWTP